MTSSASDVWLRAVGGELVSAAAVMQLRWRDGEVGALLAAGSCLRLAAPGCPPEFHHELLADLARARRIYDDRWIVILTAEVTSQGAWWISATTDEASMSGDREIT